MKVRISDSGILPSHRHDAELCWTPRTVIIDIIMTSML